MSYKNKYTDQDNWLDYQIEDALSQIEDEKIWLWWEDWEHENYCNCYSCRPDDWASLEDEESYYKSKHREDRFRVLFGENNVIGNYCSYSQISDKSN